MLQEIIALVFLYRLVYAPQYINPFRMNSGLVWELEIWPKKKEKGEINARGHTVMSETIRGY